MKLITTLLNCIFLSTPLLPIYAQDAPKSLGRIEILDPALEDLLDISTPIEILSSGHDWIEGPVWIKDGGYLLLSEIPKNQILKWAPNKSVSIFREPSGYTGLDKFTGREPGSNGLILDAQGRLVMCCHGDRAVRRMEKGGNITTLAATYKGKRFNSPNDLVYHPNGDLFFTDPPYGLPKGFKDPGREIEWCGVYRLAKNGQINLVSKNIGSPNGIALSPDGKTLYVAQSNGQHANWTVFDVAEDGSTSNERIFFDSTFLTKEWKGAPDGMVIDSKGNIWGSGPGGILIISPEGKLLGRILTGQHTSNATFGEGGSSLFITADMFLLRVKTKTKGQGY